MSVDHDIVMTRQKIYNVHVGCQHQPIDFFCLWTKVHQIFLPNVEVVGVEQAFVQMFGYISRLNSKVVRNRAEIWTFFGPPKFFGADLPKGVRAL